MSLGARIDGVRLDIDRVASEAARQAIELGSFAGQVEAVRVACHRRCDEMEQDMTAAQVELERKISVRMGRLEQLVAENAAQGLDEGLIRLVREG